MLKATLTAVGGFALLPVAGCATPPPNAVGVTGMGGGVYYNPYRQTLAPQSVNRESGGTIGTALEGGGIYRSNWNG